MARTFNPAQHPRDRFGRFTKSRTVKANAKDRKAALEVAERFAPKQMSRQERSAYLQQIADRQPEGAFADVLEANKALRSGKDSDAADRVDAAMTELPDDVLLSRAVPLSAFGNTDPASLQGMKVRDAGFAPTQYGTVRPADGQVRMHIAAPAGTKAAVNPATGEVVLDRDTEMVVAKVAKNDAGGHDMWLTVLPKQGAKTSSMDDGREKSNNATPKPNSEPEGDDAGRADLMKLKVADLQKQMRERGLKPGRMRKSQMVDALVADETGGDSPEQAGLASTAAVPDAPATPAPAAKPSADVAVPSGPDPATPVADGELPLGARSVADLVRNMQGVVVSTEDKQLINDFVIARLPFNDPASGITVTPTGASVRAGKITVSFVLTDSDGNKVGKSSRIFKLDGADDEPTMVNNKLELDSSVQGSGFAARFAARNEAFAQAQGINRVSLTANIDVGGYAWARSGYDFADLESAQNLGLQAKAQATLRGPNGDWDDATVGAFQALVDRTEKAGTRDEAPTPLEWAMVGWTPNSGSGRSAMWPGKQMMLGRAWEGERYLSPRNESTPDSPQPAPLTVEQFDARIKEAAGSRKALDATPLSALPRSRNDPAMKPEFKRALADWKIGEAGDVEHALSSGGDISPVVAERIKTYDDMMAASALPSDAVYYRTAINARDVFGSAVGGDLAGVELHRNDFFEVTASKKRADDNSWRGLQMRILAPKGAGAVAVSAGAGSGVLLDRNHTYRVVKDHGKDADGRRRLDVEMVPKTGRESDPFRVVETAVTSADRPLSPEQVEALPGTPLGRGLASGIASSRTLTGGNVGDVRLVTFNDGSQAIQKLAQQSFAGTKPKELTDTEDLAGQVGRAIGAPVPEVVRTNPAEVFMEYVPNAKPGMTVLNRHRNLAERAGKLDEFADSRDGRLLGVLDLITANRDRHAGNWLVRKDGTIAGIDHGLTWSTRQAGATDVRATVPDFDSPFAGRLFGDQFSSQRGWRDNDLTPADVAWMRKQVAALRPAFERLGREAWLDYTLVRLEQLGEHARGTENRVAP